MIKDRETREKKNVDSVSWIGLIYSQSTVRTAHVDEEFFKCVKKYKPFVITIYSNNNDRTKIHIEC